MIKTNIKTNQNKLKTRLKRIKSKDQSKLKVRIKRIKRKEQSKLKVHWTDNQDSIKSVLLRNFFIFKTHILEIKNLF